MEKDAFYFPHFSNARKDRKLRRVIKQLGVEGYGIYFMLLEVLREENDFKFPLQDIDLLADEFGTSEQKVLTVITNYELFNVDENENFFSMKFIEYLRPYLETKHKRKISGIKGNLIKYGYCKKEDLEGLTDLEIIELNDNKQELLALPSHCDRNSSQSKVKESKVKESKVKESKVNKKEKIELETQKYTNVNTVVQEREHSSTRTETQKYTNVDANNNYYNNNKLINNNNIDFTNCKMELNKMLNGSNQNVKPIPDIKTDIKTDNIILIESKKEKTDEEKLYGLYELNLKKGNKSYTLKRLSTILKKYSFEQIEKSIENYYSDIEKNKTEEKYITSPENFFGSRQEKYLMYIDLEKAQ